MKCRKYATSFWPYLAVAVAIQVPLAIVAPVAQAAPAQGTGAAAASGVAAEVNGEKIMNADVEDALEWMKNRAPSLTTDTEAARAALATMRQNVLNNLITQRLLYQEARRQNITTTDKDVEAVLADTKDDIGIKTDDDYQKFLTQMHKTDAEVRRGIVERLMVGELTKKWMDDVKVTDDDIKQYYEENKMSFALPVTLSVRHILFKVKPTATDAEREAIRTHAQAVLKKALNDEDFATLAKTFSTDTISKDVGGKIGLLAENESEADMKPLAKAAFATAVGKVYPSLVQSSYGYHIIKVDSKNPARPLKLEEVKEFIRTPLYEMKKRDRWEAEVKKLRDKAQIKIM
jgi:parvulin-like peptidyl-prolyl isomerase